MTETALTINFTASAADRDRSVVLESTQRFNPDPLPLTKGSLYFILLSKINPTASNRAWWMGDDKRWINAYPSPPDLPYRFGVSYGSHGERRVHDGEYTEVIECNMDSVIIPKRYVMEMYSWKWLGQAYDSEGAHIDPAPFTRLSEDGKRLLIDVKVYGLISISYRRIYHLYLLGLPEYNLSRYEEPDEKYVTYAYAAWDGGNTYVGVERKTPPVGTPSGGGGGIIIDDEDGGGDGYIKGEDEIHEFDYCTGEELT